MAIIEGLSFPMHLWIYNHPFRGISDQIGFFSSVFCRYGYTVTVGRRPRRDALNVVIENFDRESRSILESFCRATGKRVAVIMTEHLDFIAEQLHVHGNPLSSDNDYMHPVTQVARIRNLIECLPYIRSFFVLGDLPRLQNLHQVVHGMDIRWLPFPELCLEDIALRPQNARHDLLFTGRVTEYRSNLLGLLQGLGLQAICPHKTVSHKRRNELNRRAKIVLNLPQRKGWPWLSLMRIIAALRCGRATISLETDDASEIAACAYQVSLSQSAWEDRLKDHLVHWRERFEEALTNYQDMSRSFAERHPFPHDMLEFWAVTDRLAKPQTTLVYA